jgi:DivIVA domain-containing protein
MLSFVAFVAFVVGVLVVGTLLFLGASLLMGRGETQEPADPGTSPVALPGDRPVTGDDVRALQMSVTARGYRMTEVDWLIDQFALVLDERDAEIAELRAHRHVHPAAPAPAKEDEGAGAGPLSAGDPAAVPDDDEEYPRA